MSPTQFTFSLAFFLGLSGLSFHRAHLLSALLCLETMMLSLFIGLSVWALYYAQAVYLVAPLILLAYSACEASAGLALLVSTSRTHGSDNLQNLSLLQC